MSLSAPDLTQQNLLDSPSAAVEPAGHYWLVYSTDNPVGLGDVADAINAQTTDLIPMGGGSQTADGVSIPVRIATNPSTRVVGTLTDPVQELDLGLDLSIGGFGIGPRIGGGAVLRLTFMVPADVVQALAGGGVFTDQGAQVLGAATASGQLAANKTRASQAVDALKKGAAGAGAAASRVLSTVEILALLLIVGGIVYLFGKRA